MTSGYVPPFRLLAQGLNEAALDGTRSSDGPVTVDGPFLRFLVQEFIRALPFDAAYYERSYPDVAAALGRGALAASHEHFILNGFREGRQPHPVRFDPAFYLARNPDLAPVFADGGAPALLAHYQHSGRYEGRVAHPLTETDALRWAQAAQAGQLGTLASRTIEGALIQAFREPLVAPRPDGFRGGLVLTDSAADRLLRHRRGHDAVDSFPADTGPIGALAGEYVYGGPAYGHFGHVMSEMIHRVLPARALFSCRRLLFAGAAGAPALGGFETLAPVMQAPLRFLGVDPADVTVLRDTRVVERLHVVQQGSEIPTGPSPPYLRLLAAYTPARLDALHDGRPFPPRLYVSRSRLHEGGLLLGERYLEQLLEAERWSVLHPQDHTLVEQMQFYHRAGTAIFLSGSACHGVELFGAAGLGHAVLLPRGHTPNSYFETVLRPRARRYDALPGATLMGSIVIDRASGDRVEQLGVSIANLPALAEAMRSLELARFAALDAARYRAQALADLDAYIGFHRQRAGRPEAGGLTIAEPAEVDALRARCAALLG